MLKFGIMVALKRDFMMLRVNKHIELKNSLEWFKLSFYTFRESPLHFIIISAVALFLNLLPMFGAFMAPLFTARFALLANKVEQGHKIALSDLFEKLFANPNLIRLAFFNFSLNVLIFIAHYLLEQYLINTNGGVSISLAPKVAMLLFLLPLLIVQIAMWLAPIICLFYPQVAPITAMGVSIKASFHNLAPFLLYFLLLIVFTLISLLPLGLGLFVWLPVLNISAYYIYKTLILDI